MGFISCLLGIFGCRKQAEEPAQPEPHTNARKKKTEAELRKLGIPVNAWLPVVESEDEVRIRDPKDVARRAAVLHAVIAAGHGGDRAKLITFLKDENLWEHASPQEKAFLESDTPEKQAVIDATWRAEALWTLLWSLGKVDKLALPTKPCDMDRLQEPMPGRGEVAEFVNSATLRPKSEILDEIDRIYRIHWAVRDAEINNKPIPAGLDSGVVEERHYTLNWLTWYADEWDDVTTDT